MHGVMYWYYPGKEYHINGHDYYTCIEYDLWYIGEQFRSYSFWLGALSGD